MYTAKVVKKEIDNGIVKVFVEFTDGVNSQTEWCIPQDRQGFNFWVKSRLAVFNTGKELQTDLVDGADIDVSDTPVLPSQDELDKQTWFAKYNELEILEKIASKNFLTGARLTALNNKISNTKKYLDDNVKVEYLNFI
jgi:hypothetical protein